MINLLKYIVHYFILLFNRKNVKISFFSKISFNTLFEGYNRVGRNVGLYNSKIGLGSYISKECDFAHTIIGKYCSIGQRVKTIHGIHPTSKFVSTHPAFFSTLNQAGFHFADKCTFNEHKRLYGNYSIVIGNDVWIGNDVRILEGLTIGDGAIIGACSLIVKDVPPYAIVVGIPGNIIKYRFDEKTIKKLIESKWWNWSFKTIKHKRGNFDDISLFLNG